MNPIQDDEQYEEVLARIVKGAEFLDNPIIKPSDYERGMKRYEELCQAARTYRKSNAS